MGFELINRITIKKDGVYVSTHSSNDTEPYHSVKVPLLSKAYDENGQFGLDKAVMKLLYSQAELRGKHPSLERYYYALNRARETDIINDYLDILNNLYYNTDISQEDYLQKKDELKDEMYSKIANYCDEYEKSKNGVKMNDKEEMELDIWLRWC